LLIILIGLIGAIIPSLFNQLRLFIDAIPSLISNIDTLLNKLNLGITSQVFISNLQIKFDKLVGYFTHSFSFVVDIGIVISSAFFISYDYDSITKFLKNKIPNIIKNETLYFFEKYLPFFSKYIYSLFLDSIITFFISFALFWIFKVEYALIGALIITFTNLIPYIGPLIGIIPLIVIGYSISEYFAIISLVIVLLVQLLESNIIQPLIFKNVIKLHPIEGIASLLICSYLFGIIGLLFAPLIAIAFKILFVDKYDREKVTF
jgi:predicted PurR-regulated permease PerM